MAWPARGNSESQTHVRYSASAIEQYKAEYLTGVGFDELGRKYNVTPGFLSRIAKSQGWFIPRAKWCSTFNVGDRNGGRKAKLKCLQSGNCLTAYSGGFRAEVTRLSKMIVKEYGWYVGKQKAGHELDHLYSVWATFYNPKGLASPCTLFEVCHPCNLRFIPWRENIAKGKWPGISLKKLRNNIAIFNALYGDPFVEEPFASFIVERWDPRRDRIYHEIAA